MILVLSQRDIRHSRAGGAEKYLHHVLIGLAKHYKVLHLGLLEPGMPEEEIIDGVRYVRKGSNLCKLAWHGFRLYRKCKNEVKLLIDHSNTHQFFTFLYAPRKRLFFIHQTASDIWEYVYGPVIGKIGRSLESALLRCSKGPTITVSKSTQSDLADRGYTYIAICPEGNSIKFETLPASAKKDYFVYVGRLVKYKRVEDAILLASKAGKRLYIIGDGDLDYKRTLQNLSDRLAADCIFTGSLFSEEKDTLIMNATYLIMPSIREGWGLVITEAANLGTPSLVYNAPGVCEAVDYGRCGFVAESRDWESLYHLYTDITEERYQRIRQAAFEFSLTLSWERTSDIFFRLVTERLRRMAKEQEG